MLEQLPRGSAQIGLLVRRLSGHDRDIFRGLFFHDVHGIVECDDTDHSVVTVNDWQGEEVVLGQLLGNLFLVHQGAHGDDVRSHQGFHRHALVLGKHQVLGGNQTEDAVEPGQYVTGVDCFLVHAGLADLVECLAYGHVGRKGHVLGGHDRACGVLGELQDLVDLTAPVRSDVLQNPGNDVRGHFLDDVCGIVYIQFIENLLELGIRETADQDLLIVGFHLDECIGRQCLGEQAEHDRKLILRKLVENRCDVRRVHGDQHVLDG